MGRTLQPQFKPIVVIVSPVITVIAAITGSFESTSSDAIIIINVTFAMILLLKMLYNYIVWNCIAPDYYCLFYFI